MRISIEEGEQYAETEILIRCRKTDPELVKLISLLQVFDRKLTGIREGQTFLLEAADILYIDTADKKTFLYTADEVYETPLRLYELEERLATSDFFRASKSSIINFNGIRSLRPDFGGRMFATMVNGEQLVISRQYVPYVKQKLGL
ncbi:LytTR family DNA-binding domain-containing protein [uncultured Neglectibacter sp.]|uniref:LytTR family DNA-binding domain-containing protein n=1 Tax=uncultured Neglectibacter sp. TaxID=1924108 RepID=UPI0034DE3436